MATAVNMAEVSAPDFNDSLGLQAADHEVIYNLAYSLYQQTRFAEAERAFGLLCLSAPNSERFWLGLAASRQLQKNYHTALLAYRMANAINAENPTTALHSAECYLAAGLIEQTQQSLDEASRCSDRSDSPATLRDRIDVLRQALQQTQIAK